MANQIDENGLVVDTSDETRTRLEEIMRSAYGDDINLDSDTADGQWVGNVTQIIQDLLQLIKKTNSMFDPDQAVGVILDQRVAINGIERKGGSYTITPISITTDRALNLEGLDDDAVSPSGTGYTVQDDQGNKWILLESQAIADAGTYVLSFRAEKVGQVSTVPNTITNPVTSVLGVTGINNPTTYTLLGAIEEQDPVLKVRRRKSVAIAAQAIVDALEAMLENLAGVSGATVIENVSDAIDGDTIPAHSIWAIVNGGTPEEIANAIYAKRSMGAGMKGTNEHTIIRPNGIPFTVRWDDVEPENLFMKLHLKSINGIDELDLELIKAQLVLQLVPAPNQGVNITQVGTLIQSIDPNAMVVPTVGDGFGYNAVDAYLTILSPSAKNKQFVVSADNMDFTEV